MKEIERLLGVSRSSVSRWIRNVELGTEQRARLAERTRLGPLVAAERKAARARAARAACQEVGRQLARERGPRYAAGCALYWAEGSKERNTVKLTNSDPALLAYFARFLRTELDVADDRMRVRCNLFADHRRAQREIEDHWRGCLGLPRSALRTSTVNVYSKYSAKKRANKLPYGTGCLMVHSTELVQTIYGSIQELAGIERRDWLD